MNMYAVINNKSFVSTIEVVNGKIRRTDREGDVITNLYNALAHVCTSANASDKLYVSRFLHKMLEEKQHDYWLSEGKFRNGAKLTKEQNDAVLNFLCSYDGVTVFENIDKHTLNDLPELSHEHGLLLTEVVSCRADWNRKVVRTEEKELLAPSNAKLTTNPTTVNGFLGMSAEKETEKKEEIPMPKTEPITLNLDAIEAPTLSPETEKFLATLMSQEAPLASVAPVAPIEEVSLVLNLDAVPVTIAPAPVVESVVESVVVAPEPVAETIILNLDEPKTKPVQVKPNPRKSLSKDTIVLNLDEENPAPSFFLDPFQEHAVPLKSAPPALTPSGLSAASLVINLDETSPSTVPASGQGVVIELTSALPPKTKSSSLPLASKVFTDLVARKTRRA